MKFIPILILLALFLCGCGGEALSSEISKPYTADQVIDIVHAQYPTCCWGNIKNGKVVPSNVSVFYKGEGVWEVTVSCPSFYRLGWTDTSSRKTLHFYEASGSLR